MADDGSFSYQPDPNYTGEVQFAYGIAVNGVVGAGAQVLLAQAGKAVPKLQSVSFLGGIQVYQDPTVAKNGAIQAGAPYGSKQWLDLNLDGTIDKTAGSKEVGAPIAYISESVMHLSAEFKTTNEKRLPGDDKMMVRGEVYNGQTDFGMGILATRLQWNDQTKAYSISNVAVREADGSVGVLPDKSDEIDHLVVNWEISLDGGKTWRAAGASDNDLFITLSRPLEDRVYVTLLSLSTVRGVGGGAGAFDLMIPDIFDRFAGQNVQNYAGQPLTYYGSWDTRVATVEGLLATRDGMCGAWQNLLIRLYETQGIPKRYYKPVGAFASTDGGMTANTDVFFMVNNWQFPNGAQPGQIFTNTSDPRFAHQPPFVTPGTPSYDAATSTYRWLGNAPVQDQTGFPGQNTANPLSTFNNHAIVQVTYKGLDGTTITAFFDPSYGLIYQSASDMDARAIAGYFTSATKGNRLTHSMRINDPNRVEMVIVG
jgi:hypothetical protein